MSGTPAAEGPRLIRIGIAAFLVACVVLLLVAPKLSPKGAVVPRFAPSGRASAGQVPGTFRATLDARAEDRFVGFDFGTGAPSERADASADLLARRHVLVAPHGALDLGDLPLASAALPAGATFTPDPSRGDAWENRALRHWYRYSYWTHVVAPRATTWAVRRADGSVAFVRFAAYYCEPDGAGCLTMEYRL